MLTGPPCDRSQIVLGERKIQSKRASSSTAPSRPFRQWHATAVNSMTDTPPHITLLRQTAEGLTSSDGIPVQVWELEVDLTSDCIPEWAARFRDQYCTLDELAVLSRGSGLTPGRFLETTVFPDPTEAPGPSIRAGDFSELLVADFVEHVLGLWVPRGRYSEKSARNESPKGVDVLGFRFTRADEFSPNDELLAVEVKASLSGSRYKGHLQDAVDHSAKDALRTAETLYAIKRRFHRANLTDQVRRVERFQNVADNPFVRRYAAAALINNVAFRRDRIAATDCREHANRGELQLLVIRGRHLMALAHRLYKAAVDAC